MKTFKLIITGLLLVLLVNSVKCIENEQAQAQLLSYFNFDDTQPYHNYDVLEIQNFIDAFPLPADIILIDIVTVRLVDVNTNLTVLSKTFPSKWEGRPFPSVHNYIVELPDGCDLPFGDYDVEVDVQYVNAGSELTYASIFGGDDPNPQCEGFLDPSIFCQSISLGTMTFHGNCCVDINAHIVTESVPQDPCVVKLTVQSDITWPILTYEWSTGETSQSIYHLCGSETYTVTITWYEEPGDLCMEVVSLSVYSPCDCPIDDGGGGVFDCPCFVQAPTFDYTDNAGCDKFFVFQEPVTNSCTQITDYEISWGDGEFDGGNTHTFPHDGVFNVCVKVKGYSNGGQSTCEDEYCQEVTIFDCADCPCYVKAPMFDYTDNSGCTKFFVFEEPESNQCTEIIDYEISWGDGEFDGGDTHTFPNNGIFNVCVKVTGTTDGGETFCDDEYCQDVVVIGCNGLPDDETLIPSNGREGELSGISMNMHPNPADDKVVIRLNDSKEGISRMSIYNISGQLMEKYRDIGNSIEIDVSGYTEGLYMVEIVDHAGHHKIDKLIIK